MVVGSEWTFPLPSEPILPLPESTWDDLHMAVAAAVAAVVVVVHHAAQGTMTEVTIGVTIEVMTATMIVMMTASIDHTDADLHLRTTAEGTAPDLGPTHHVTTEQMAKWTVLLFECLFLFLCFDQIIYVNRNSEYVHVQK